MRSKLNKKEIIIIGAGGHAKSCIDVIEQEGKYNIVGLIGVENEEEKEILNYKVIGLDSSLNELSKKYKYAFNAIGQIKTPQLRISAFKNLQELGFITPSIISPNSQISPHASIGSGTIVMHGVIINSDVKIGSNCIINSNSLLEHDVEVENNCHISTGAILNGNVKVKSNSFIGSGTIIKEGVLIEENCVIGMGLSIKKNINKSLIYSGA